MPIVDNQGFQHIIGLDGFFRLPDHEEFQELAKQYPQHIKVVPYNVANNPLFNGLLITISDCDIKEVTGECFPKDWWYDRAFLIRIASMYLLCVQRMTGTVWSLELLDEERLQKFQGFEPNEGGK